MDSAWLGLVGAAIGALAGFGGAAVTARATTQAEADRRRNERAAEHEREARQVVGELAGLMSRAIQTIDWFTWQAAQRATAVSTATVDAYDAEIKTQFPTLMESMSRVAAINPEAFGRFRPHAEEVFKLDREVSDAASGVGTDRDTAIARIASLQDRADELFDRFQQELADWAAGVAGS